MSSCYAYYCSQNCCNYYGYCPSSTGSSLNTQCYYYYDYYYYNVYAWWIYLIIGICSLIGLCIIIAIISCIVRRRKANYAAQNTVVVEGGTSPSYSNPDNGQGQYNQNYQQGNNAAYEMGNMNMNNQAYYGEPVRMN